MLNTAPLPSADDTHLHALHDAWRAAKERGDTAAIAHLDEQIEQRIAMIGSTP